MTVIPRAFECTTSERSWEEELVVVAPLDSPPAIAILAAIDAVDWAALSHAYHAATDTRAHLIAVAVSDDRGRHLARNELWGSVRHQGTVDSATVAAVPIIAALARWADYPDRAMALVYLRELAVGDGREAPVVRAGVHDEAPALLANGLEEPEAVQRALVWLLTAFPEHAVTRGHLVAAVLPEAHRDTWQHVLAVSPDYWPDSDAEYDAYSALERWASVLAFTPLAD